MDFVHILQFKLHVLLCEDLLRILFLNKYPVVMLNFLVRSQKVHSNYFSGNLTVHSVWKPHEIIPTIDHCNVIMFVYFLDLFGIEFVLAYNKF
jgi:hypothetical protein